MNRIFFLIAVLALSVSCGKKGDSSKKSNDETITQSETTEVLDGSNIQGTYLARLQTLNGQVNGTIPASATFKRDENDLYAYVRIFAGGPSVWHQQNVYIGNRCPSIQDDTNGDGFIDVAEGNAVWGKIIIPLDADLSSQSAGKNFYPMSDLSGSYYYERITSFNKFFKDLKSDEFVDERMTKLSNGEGFDFADKVVVIFGVAESISLPETVATEGRRKSFQTLPIACGIIRKVSWDVGTPDNEEIPGPIGEVEEGQDRPGEVNEERPTGTDPSGSTGTAGGTNTNETNTEETDTSNGENH